MKILAKGMDKSIPIWTMEKKKKKLTQTKGCADQTILWKKKERKEFKKDHCQEQ